MNFKALELTSIVMKIPRGLRPGNLRKAWEKQEVQKKWDSTTWAQKIANKKKVGYLLYFILIFICTGIMVLPVGIIAESIK